MNTFAPGTVAYSYIRFSSRGQAVGTSVERQTQLAKQFLDAHPGVILDTSLHLHDLGVSGFSGANRLIGRLGAFLKAIKENRVARGSLLLIENYDRLSREHITRANEIFTGILNAGITIVVISDPANPKVYSEDILRVNPYLMFEVCIEQIRASEESKRKSDLASKNWEIKRKRAITEGKGISRQCPAWLKPILDDKGRVVSYEPIPDRVEAIRYVFKEALHCGHNVIAQKMTGKFPPIGNSGEWQGSYISVILHNRAVLGEYRSALRVGNAKKLTGEVAHIYPPIISEAEFAAAQNAIRQRNGTGKVGRSGDVANLFQRITRCATCGTTMQMFKAHDRKYLRCTKRAVEHTCDNSTSLRYAEFEAAMLKFVVPLAFSQPQPANDQGNKLREQKTKVESQLANLRARQDMLSLEDDPQGDLVSSLRVIGTKIRELESEIASLESDIARHYAKLPSPDRANLIAHYIKSVNHPDIKIRQPARYRLMMECREVIDFIKVQPDRHVNVSVANGWLNVLYNEKSEIVEFTIRNDLYIEGSKIETLHVNTDAQPWHSLFENSHYALFVIDPEQLRNTKSFHYIVKAG